jgi:hypothetical protein
MKTSNYVVFLGVVLCRVSVLNFLCQSSSAILSTRSLQCLLLELVSKFFYMYMSDTQFFFFSSRELSNEASCLRYLVVFVNV